MYNVTLREGDAVFIHTGWGDLFKQFPAQNAAYNSARARHRQGGGEVARRSEGGAGGRRHMGGRGDPRRGSKEAFPVHKMLLTDNGIHIIENVRTDLIAAEAASSNRATFFFSMTVPKAVGHDRHLRQYRSNPVVCLEQA